MARLQKKILKGKPPTKPIKLVLPYSDSIATDVDVFTIGNTLQSGQSDADTSRLSTIVGRSTIAHGVHGVNGNGSGTPQYGTGVWGESDNGFGVCGTSQTNSGVQGTSIGFDGVHGESQSAQHAGVSGINNSGGTGVSGMSSQGAAVSGYSQGGVGVSGTSQGGTGVTAAGGFAGVFATSDTGTAIVAQTNSGQAADFTGKVTIAGDVSLPTGSITLATGDVVIGGADCAEEFDVGDEKSLEPGTVVVIGEVGAIRESREAYDKRVAGVISGGGNCRPGILLGRTRFPDRPRASVALVGNVFCKVDASYSPVGVGDLLTTSPTPGHAMRATDPIRAFGAVIGKAMQPLAEGQGLIPILIALQ